MRLLERGRLDPGPGHLEALPRQTGYARMQRGPGAVPVQSEGE